MNIYKAALDVQDACNLSGVVNSFSAALKEIWEEARAKGEGTDYVNTHPVSKLFADKIVDLARVRDFEAYSDAYGACTKKVEEDNMAKGGLDDE